MTVAVPRQDVVAFLTAASLYPGNATPCFVRSYYTGFEVPAGARLLDFGAYTGGNLFHWATKGHDIDGIEIGPAYVNRYRELCALGEPGPGKARMLFGLVDDYEPEGLYDVVLCGETLNHTPDPDAMVAKAAQCLRPGGCYFVAVPHRKQPADRWHWNLPELKALIELHPFRVTTLVPWRPVQGENAVAQTVCIATRTEEDASCPS